MGKEIFFGLLVVEEQHTAEERKSEGLGAGFRSQVATLYLCDMGQITLPLWILVSSDVKCRGGTKPGRLLLALDERSIQLCA